MQSTDFFIENNIVTISSGVKVIQSKILPDRKFSCIYIPKTVEQIYPNAINCDVTYDGIHISKEEIATYGCENIPRMVTFKKYQLDFANMPREVFLLLPLTNDAMKGYKANHVYYEVLRQKVKHGEDSNFFKICYTMGLFIAPPKTRIEIEKAILYVYSQSVNLDQLDQLTIGSVNLTFVQLVVGFYRNGQLLDFMPYYSKMYNNCKEICKIIKRIKTQMLYEKKHELKEYYLRNEGMRIGTLKEEIEKLELYQKTITFSDIQDYFLNHAFVVREGNEALEQIMPIIKANIYSQKSFDILQDIYEEAKKMKRDTPQIFTSLIKNCGKFTYRWLENDSVENLILGYLTNCCAKLNGDGEDIMRLSMIHPQVRTLVVYDDFQKIIGKSTVFYSLEGKYLLANTIEVAHHFINSSKVVEKQKQELLNAFLEGLKAQVAAMEKRGYTVGEVRVGMGRNDLEEQLLNQYNILKTNLLPNIEYGSYRGDASNESLGQAVLPIGKDVKR